MVLHYCQTMHLLCIWSSHSNELRCHQTWPHRQGNQFTSENQSSFIPTALNAASVFVVVLVAERSIAKQQTASSVLSLKLFIVSRDKQSLRVIHAALRCTIRLVEHFLTHSWLPPSYYDSEAQGEKKVSDFRAFFCVYVFVCVSMSSYICVDRF